ncbi:MAG: rhodanese-like domain-containing protein [Balneolaceae bacterium]|nr:rhodanese-like domain-containing protein [Balneolaceae bacterium]
MQLVDVREPHEVEIAEIGGELIPLDTILDNADKISRDKKVVVHCRSGQRSADAIKQLQEKYGFDNLYNLKGGITRRPVEGDIDGRRATILSSRGSRFYRYTNW